ncbi:hypothetical protein [Dactylosporangium sp. CA-092794]|uniref:hypothetical protein n=1 Tax=Dactylosporangium sp. CA-092794 TaxID=3239929 RepID=UPI003D93662D
MVVSRGAWVAVPALALATVLVAGCGLPGPATGAGGGGAAPARNVGATPKVTLSAPASLGSWRQPADQSVAGSLAGAFTDAKSTFGVQYQQTGEPPRTLIVLGGLAARFQPEDETIQEDAFYAALNKRLGASRPGVPKWVDGHIGGKSACARTDSRGTAYAVCTWLGPGVLIAFLFPGAEVDAAAREMEPLVGEFLTISP